MYCLTADVNGYNTKERVIANLIFCRSALALNFIEFPFLVFLFSLNINNCFSYLFFLCGYLGMPFWYISLSIGHAPFYCIY